MSFDETEAYNKDDSMELVYYKNKVEKFRKELASLREQLKIKESELTREIKFVLDNCKSYLEVFKDEWKEGEEILHSEISRLSAKLGK